MMLAAILPVLLAFSPVVVDKAAHSVTFTAKATDVTPGTTLEFAFVGPESDRAYEAMFVTDASISELAKAFSEAGIPCGRAVDHTACRFWPAGKKVTIEPSLRQYINDSQSSEFLPILYTGGQRDQLQLPTANTNMPSAFFALYNLDQSLLLFDDATEQSAVYGRFTSTGKAKGNERIAFKVSWDGKSGSESRNITFSPGKTRKALEALKDAKTDLDVTVSFSPDLTLSEAKAAASALSVIDSRTIKINGFIKGQIFYKGFLPDEKWRNRQSRITQPLEVRIEDDMVIYTIIDEDWSVEGDDPKLTAHNEPLSVVCKKFKGDTCLFFAKSNQKLARIYSVVSQLPHQIRNWYVYID